MQERPAEAVETLPDPPGLVRPRLAVWVPPEVLPVVVSESVLVRLLGSDHKKPKRRRPAADDGSGRGSGAASRKTSGKGTGVKRKPPKKRVTARRDASGGWADASGIWQDAGGARKGVSSARKGVSSTRKDASGAGKPWDPEEPELLAVTPEMEAQAQEAMKQWKMKVSGMRVMATKPEKGGAIWRIETSKGPRSLKVLHRPPARSLFSIYLQDYLVKQGARVPKLIPTKTGELYTEVGGKLWIVTDWIEQLVPASKDLEGAKQLCYGLGEFHRHSRGYVPPPGAEVASRLHRWPKTYQKMAAKMNWFREVAKAYPEAPASAAVLAMVDRFEAQAKKALERLEASPYASLAARGGPAWGVVHQDYGWSNGQLGPGGIWIIDLDGVAYDLPIRDLRKLITSTMDDMGVWDPEWMRGMIEAYNEANPIEPDLYKVLLIDMSLPNEFYKHVKDMLVDPLMFLTPELDQLLQRLAASDETKWQALRELGLDDANAKVPGRRKKQGRAGR